MRNLIAMLTVALTVSCVCAGEAHYPSAAYKRLDTFEAHELAKADKAYAKNQYRQAAKLYNAFILEFPKSKAVPFALLRKGRCLQRDNKKYKAIKEYEEVLDYFPDDVAFAAPALFYKGECYWQNQDYKKAMIAWAEMAADEDYRKNPLAGTALKRLADNQMKLKKVDEAIKYYRMVILGFNGKMDRHEFNDAVNQVRYHHIRRRPDEIAFRKLYKETRGFFHRHGRKRMPKSLEEDRWYWDTVKQNVWNYGKFQEHEKGAKKSYFEHWAGVLKTRFAKDDAFQIDVAKLAVQGHGDAKRYLAQLDRIFAARRTDKNHNDRIIAWLRHLKGHKEKIAEYCSKIRWNGMSGGQGKALMSTLADVGQAGLAKTVYPKLKIKELSFNARFSLFQVIWERLRDKLMATDLFERMGLEKQTDNTKVSVARWLWKHDGELVLRTLATLKDKGRAHFERLSYYHGSMRKRRASDKAYKAGIESGQQAAKVDKYAKESWWLMAEMHVAARKWDLAIRAYRESQREPESLFCIAECFKKWGKLTPAISQLVEIENFVPARRTDAAWTQAVYYRAFRKDKEENRTLYRIMNAYTKSSAARHAHERLEAKGLPIKGALGKEELTTIRGK